MSSNQTSHLNKQAQQHKNTKRTRSLSAARTRHASKAQSPPDTIERKMRRFVQRGLTTRERLLITLHYCEDLTLHEISAILELPLKTVAEMKQDLVDRVEHWVMQTSQNSRVA
jgi:DNA-directed RNA polymerase specialized sigma24 family protein